MKKILLTAACILMLGLTVNAQPWGFGPKAGATFSTVNGVKGAKVRVGVVAGLFAERMVSNFMGYQVELLFNQQGYDVKHVTPTPKYRLDYISMPLISKYYILGGLNMQLGAQFDYLVGAKQKTENAHMSIRSDFNKYGVSFIAGLAYDFDFGLIIEGRYQLGLVNISSVTDQVTTGFLQVTAGWRF